MPCTSGGIRWTPASASTSPTRGRSGSTAERATTAIPTRTETYPQEHPLKADAAAQLRLLEVQELDSTLDALRHRLAHLSETKELEALAVERGQVDSQARDAQIRADDLTRDQKKADADVEQVKARRVRDQDRMDRGLVNNPKDLERMQEELVSLARRISDLEDTELEVMEQLEGAQQERSRLADRLAAIDARSGELTASRDANAGETTAELASKTAQRDAAAQQLTPDLLALYDRIRAQKGGVGAAALRQRRCGGCRLELTAADLSAIAKAAPDEVIRCEECGRILVRTAESGL